MLAVPSPAPWPPGQALPRYSVRELNAAIGALIERGFAPPLSAGGHRQQAPAQEGAPVDDPGG